jgi:hypothetical protein
MILCYIDDWGQFLVMLQKIFRSVEFFFSFTLFLLLFMFLKITNDNGILVFSNELNINVRMNSSAWMNALEKFDRNVDINSMTKKEVC